MARVQWARGRFKDVAHAIIDGDLVVLCGSGMVESFPAILRTETEDQRVTLRAMACSDCSAIVGELAEALGVAKPRVGANSRSVANDPVAATSDLAAPSRCVCGHNKTTHSALRCNGRVLIDAERANVDTVPCTCRRYAEALGVGHA